MRRSPKWRSQLCCLSIDVWCARKYQLKTIVFRLIELNLRSSWPCFDKICEVINYKSENGWSKKKSKLVLLHLREGRIDSWWNHMFDYIVKVIEISKNLRFLLLLILFKLLLVVLEAPLVFLFWADLVEYVVYLIEKPVPHLALHFF